MTFLTQSGSIRRPTVVQIRGRPSVKPSPFSATSGWTSISPKNHELRSSYRSTLKQLWSAVNQFADEPTKTTENN
jgi:hypothetical protein